MNTFLRNTISKVYNVVSAPVAATRDALVERLQSVRDTTSSLYNRMMENMGYGQQERLKDIVEKEAEEEEQLTATKEEQEQQEPAAQDDDDGHIRVEMTFNSPMIELCEDSDINDLVKHMFAHIKWLRVVFHLMK